MLSKKKMITLFVGFALILIAIGFAGWYFLFGRANPPLSQTQVTIVHNTSATVATSSGVVVASSSITAPPIVATQTATSINSTSVDVANSQLPTESLSIDSANFTVEVASTMIEQARGLSYRTSLGENAGMLFVFSSGTVQSFWMKDMNFPLDMIWISGNTVVGFAQDAPAEPNVAFPSQIFSSPNNTDKVLEVNAGTVAKYNIKVGDTVMIKQ
jgi:uncharacterized membrane protein (UPF0127 family)